MLRLAARLLPLAVLSLSASLPAASQTKRAAPARSFADTATLLPSGAFLLGNPRARVRLVEVVSYTCPHCADFIREGASVIEPAVARGTLAIEVRGQVHDAVDVAAATLVRCGGAARFPALHRALFAQQGAWVNRGFGWLEANQARLRLYSATAQVRATADNAGLLAIGRAAGLSSAQLDACFAGPVTGEAMRVSAATSDFSGTPGFVLAGQKIERVTWAGMQPRLAALGIK